MKRAEIIVLLRYVQDKILRKCGSDGTVDCALRVIEDIKLRIEELSLDEVERELFS